MKKINPSLFPAACWFLVSTILLILPGSAFPKDDWLGKIWFDKWVHIGMFSILVVLCCWGLLRSMKEKEKLKKAFIVVGLLGLLYGVGMEFVQKFFVPNRSFDPGDIAADAVGCLLGVIFSRTRYIKK